MSSARTLDKHGKRKEQWSAENRVTHAEGEDVSKLKSKMRDVSMRLNSLHVTSKSSLDFPSPFSGSISLKVPPKVPNRSSGAPHSLKLETSPEFLNKTPTYDYVSSKSAVTTSQTTLQSSGTPLVSPLSSSAYPTSQKSSGAFPGGQAAEMQARIMALQRSRSKRATQSASLPVSKSQSGQAQRRSLSSSSARSQGPNPLLSQFYQQNSSRSSILTADSYSTDGDEDEISSSSSPGLEKSESPVECKSLSDSSTVTLVPPFSDISLSTDSSHEVQQGATKQPLASNGFDPNSVISPTAASFAASGGGVSLNRGASFRTRQISSLSARRGMNLDTSSLKSDKPSKQRKNLPYQTGSRTHSSKGDVSHLDTANCHRSTHTNVPQESNNRGLFRDYRKYIDIETGSLNFAGKACVHARGIEFSTGEKFSISIDKLEFISELGSGNYGTVQKVLHTPNNVLMAVKEIRLELDEASLRQIIMELDVLHRCDCPNIIAFYGAFFVEGSVYICMEYMNGGSLNKIYEGGIPEKYLKYIVRSVVEGLKQLKEDFNIIHRDVKPTNILCSTDGHVKLCDFGVSGNLVASIARTNIGCQAYMAPERIKVDRVAMGNPSQPMTYTAESDIWSLGLSIIEMAKGCYPYPSDTFASIFSQLNAIVEDPAPAMDPSKYSREACDFVNNLLRKSPENRPKYADIVKHPWLAKVECTMEEMGGFVTQRLQDQGAQSQFPQTDQSTITLRISQPV